MALKTILVHLADDADHEARLKTAQSLAKTHGSHLTALFVVRPLDLPIEVTGRGASLAYLEESSARAEERAKTLEVEFRDFCGRSNLPHDWIVADSEHLPTLARHAHAADLIIVSRGPDKHLEDRFRVRLSEELVLVTGLPILVLPPGWTAPPIGKRILVGWKPTREAVRAVRDALPLLGAADKVVLATVSPTEEDALSALEAQQYLARQGVTAETIDATETRSTGETLIDMALAHEADLIVCGAYGHSRLREIVMGGVTRTLLRKSSLPLFLSH